MILTQSDYEFAKRIAFDRAFPALAKRQTFGSRIEPNVVWVHAAIKARVEKLDRREYARGKREQKWHNTLVILKGRIARHEAWKGVEYWFDATSPSSQQHVVNVKRLLRRLEGGSR